MRLRPAVLGTNLKYIICETSVMAALVSTSASSRFIDCPLVEIIHLHDCLRNALANLLVDVNVIADTCCSGSGSGNGALGKISEGSRKDCDASDVEKEIKRMREVEKKVSARFRVIWSVFQAHSKAEDDYIWPRLQEKLGDDISVGSHGEKKGALINEEDYEEVSKIMKRN